MAVLQRLALRGTPKATKAAARYTPAGGAERCGMCRHYAPSSSCARIEGPVSAAGWCMLYSQQVTWRPRAGQAAGGGVPAGLTLDMSFMTPGTLPSGLTFTRASVATYFDATGTLQTATANTPRWDYDPVTLVLRGLLLEEQRINTLLNSATLGTQSVTTTAVPTTLSFYGTGTITKSGTASGALVGTGAFPARVSQTFTPTAGTLTLTVTGSVLNAQLEAGAFATSYIPTTAAAVTRVFDGCDMTPLGGWFSLTAFTQQIEWLSYNYASGSGGALRFDDASNANYVRILMASTTPYGTNVQTFSNNVQSILSLAPPVALGAVHKQALALNASGNTWAIDGTLYGTGTGAAAMPLSLTRLRVGNTGLASSFMLNGYMRRVRYWPRVLSNAEMQQATS